MGVFTAQGVWRFQQSSSDGDGKPRVPEHLGRLQITFLQLPIPVRVQKPRKALRHVLLVLSASAARWTKPIKSALPGAGPLCGHKGDQEKSFIAGF